VPADVLVRGDDGVEARIGARHGNARATPHGTCSLSLLTARDESGPDADDEDEAEHARSRKALTSAVAGVTVLIEPVAPVDVIHVGVTAYYCLAVVPGGGSFTAHELSANIGRRSQSLWVAGLCGCLMVKGTGRPPPCARLPMRAMLISKGHTKKMRSESLSWCGDHRARAR
jgi:hypothetical protein